MARYAWIYKTARWQRTRRAVLRRDHGLCQICKANGKVQTGNQVDHIIELTDENVHDEEIVYGLDNLRTLCLECHNERHGRLPSGLEEFVNPVPRREEDIHGSR